MDEPKTVDNSEDMTVGKDGVLNSGGKNDPASGTESEVSKAPLVNEVAPPPAPETSTSDEQTIEVKVAPKEVPIDADNESAPDNVTNQNTDESTPESLAPVAVAPKPEEAQTNDAPKEDQPLKEADALVVPPEEVNKPKVEQAAPAMMGVSASQMKKHPHRNNKKLAAFVTVAVAALLAGIAVYVYVSANDNTTSQNNPIVAPQTQELTPTNEPVNASDIDEFSADVDQTINSLDEASDFPEEELSDPSLGL